MAKPKVKKIVLFWQDKVPGSEDAKAIADLLPQQMHPELIFKGAQTDNDKISYGNVLKLARKFTMVVGAELTGAALAGNLDVKKVKKEELKELIAIKTINIATMKIILDRLKKKHRFDHNKSKNRLICKYIRTTIGHCYYALILDSEINPSKYHFTTGFGGCTLSALFTELANTNALADWDRQNDS